MSEVIRTTPLSEKEKNQLFTRYMLFGCPGVDAVYLQGKSWPWWMLPFFKKYYDEEGVKENILRHFTWYNTEPIAGSLIFGIVLGLEERKATHGDVNPEMITSIKSGLMGPVAGIGDSLIQATLIPILITLCISISGENGSVVGPLLYIVLLLGIILTFGYFLYKRGFALGKESLDYFGNAGISDITKAVAVFGLIVVGCLSSTRVKIPLKIAFENNGEQSLLIDQLNTIFPNILGLAICLFFFWLLKQKGVKRQTLFFITMIVVVILSFVGIV